MIREKHRENVGITSIIQLYNIYQQCLGKHRNTRPSDWPKIAHVMQIKLVNICKEVSEKKSYYEVPQYFGENVSLPKKYFNHIGIMQCRLDATFR